MSLLYAVSRVTILEPFVVFRSPVSDQTVALGLSTISCPAAATQLHMGKGGKAKGKGKADGKGGGKGKGNLADQHSLSCAAS